MRPLATNDMYDETNETGGRIICAQVWTAGYRKVTVGFFVSAARRDGCGLLEPVQSGEAGGREIRGPWI